MFNLAIYFIYDVICNPLQAEDDQEERDERWDPDSEMEVDEERYFVLYLFRFYFIFSILCILTFAFHLLFGQKTHPKQS